MAQPMRQFIQPDFTAQPEPRLDWMPWEQAPEGNRNLFDTVKKQLSTPDKAAAVAGTAGKAAGPALGAASL